MRPGWVARVRGALPQGQTLPEDVFERRHRWMLALLWVHAAVLPVVAALAGYPVVHNLGHAAPVVVCAALAGRRWARRRTRAVLVSVGLMTCSALLVHIEHGLIEMHFHFFVMLSVLTLYEDWLPFLVALGYVVLHHTVIGAIDPGGVYDHPGNPLALAAIHGGFVAAAGVANVVGWRLNESARSEMRDGWERTRLILDTANEAYVGMDEAGTIVGWNATAADLFGWSREEAMGRSVAETIIPEAHRAAHDRGVARFVASGDPSMLGGQRWETSALHRDGREFPVELTLNGIRTASGWLFNAFLHDISERKASESLLRERASQQAAVAAFGRRALEGASAAEVMHDAAVVLAEVLGVSLSSVWEHVPGEQQLERRVIVGERAQEAPERVPAGRGSQGGATLEAHEPIVVEDWATETRFQQPAAAQELGLASGISVVIEGREQPFGVLIAHTFEKRVFSPEDVSFTQAVAHTLATAIERLQAEERSRHAALHDALTGLPNRALLLDRLGHALARNRRRDSRVGVFFIDVDQFKVINDSLGHAAGDRLLEVLAPRLATAVRAHDTVARFGGDEFVVLAEELDGPEVAQLLGERILAAIAEPMEVEGDDVVASASIGIALADAESDADSLLRDADAAMYRAKERGRGRVELFDSALRARAVGRLRLESALRRAVEHQELHLAYQPIVSLSDGAMVGAEALCRWEHPELGAISPGEFIALAEETGLIVPLGRWVLEHACREAAGWQAGRSPGAPPIGLCVNVSPRQLSHGDFPATVADILRSTGLPPSALTLEITETVLLERGDRGLATLEALKATGVQMALDDFGSGYSSLGYLRRLPIDIVKLDRAFIADLAGAQSSSTAIVSAVVTMAHALGLDVIAEGVETEAQAQALRELGCARAQGYHFGRPGPAAGLLRLLEAPDRLAA